ncbi:MAG TPA: PEP-utilizing enzyme [Candidatus Thermoplasmatota archaeon]|jgi:pyruvate,water dikinase|nr:PEP-utilizing enzyme [Candidatus Thermoplasmatota archaeon]
MPGYWFREDMHLPRPVSPLARTVLIPPLIGALQRGMTRTGGPGHLLESRVEHGYAYVGFRDTAPLRAPPPPEALAAMQAAFAEVPRRWREAWLPEMQRLHAQLRAIAPPGASAAEAARGLRQLRPVHDRAWDIHFDLCMPMLGGRFGLEDFLAQAGLQDAAAAANALLGGLGNDIDDIDAALVELGAQVAERPELRALVEDGAPEELLAALEALPASDPIGRAFRAVWPRVAERPQGFELFEPTWGEDPAPLARALAGGHAAAKQAEALRAQVAQRREAAEARVRAALPATLRGPFEGLLAANRASWPLMQTHHYWIDELVNGLTRLALVRAAQPLVGHGLAAAEEVVFLELQELHGALEGQRIPRGLLEARRRERDAHLRITPPSELGEPDAAVWQNPMLTKFYGLRPPHAAEAGLLRGLAASPGMLRARARVVAQEGELDALEQGEVLVATTTEPSWTTLMARAGALVVESGGTLCHAAVVAREFGVPAVVGARGATRAVKTGDILEVDGAAGTVKIVEA